MRTPRYNRSEFDAHAALMQAGMKRAVRKTSKPVPRYWGRYLSALFFVACGATVATAVASFVSTTPRGFAATTKDEFHLATSHAVRTTLLCCA